ncbi:formate dehydrogenase accessory sulfurtransferase FdhD [Halobacillus sp. A5]|uniref:formate dehydrogenase accessory sulfurtransferase FdhD n=1 Tax=Halobacillus sp. A5 TaxID=2880263 RepID=UPI0020A6CFE7|nr:formate dehydrogenase accessory sulfurtransferase FdhD [Halobacillus sp. A5]MCP3026395.1 formate dehydrogenase accessory sulfurtransferase FdhD [Halobacillus sp. A5]
MNERMSVNKSIVRFKDGNFNQINDHIVTEFPMTIYVNNEEFATMVCTPAHFDEMVIGFLASEGVIRFRNDIKALNIDEEKGFAYVELAEGKEINNQRDFSKRFIGSCCGKSRQFYFQNDVQTAKTSTAETKITADQCIRLMQQMQDNSHVFKGTGGVHNAAICTSGEMVVGRTDIGRHNALDKLYGHCLMNQISVRDKILVFSGRISSEVLTKAAKIGVGIVLSKSAPTDLAVQLAEDLNITAVGFIRGSSFNIYSHPRRVTN